MTTAQTMADDTMPHDVDETSEQYLTFMLAGEEYGVNILRVQEIKGWDAATPIPNTPDYILGVINLRGAVVPIVDLRKRFDVLDEPFGPTTVVIVVKVSNEGRERTVGMVADAVSDVYRLDSQEVQSAPDFGSSVDTAFVRGLATVGNKMVILLDIDQLVNFEALGVVVETTAN